MRLTHVLHRRPAEKRVPALGEHVVWTDSIDQVLGADVDIFVELIGGEEPAGTWIRQALCAGKSVVTANKQVMALHGPELLALAAEHGCELAYGASVAGGIPVLSSLQQGLAGDRITAVSGILNGTCNYILTRMEQDGSSFEDALAGAQRAGFAEADPASDVDGFDARAKLVILSRIALGVQVTPAQVVCHSIRPVAAVDFHYVHELQSTIRQISYAALEGDTLHITVQPMLVRRSSAYAAMQGPQNLVVSTGVHGGSTTFSGNGAGGGPTAVAVVSDLLALARSGGIPAALSPAALPQGSQPRISADLVAPHYLRFLVRDRPGILAALSAVLAEHHINVDSVLQKPGYPAAALPFVITLEPCSQGTLNHALAQLSHFDFLVEPPLCLPRLETPPPQAL